MKRYRVKLSTEARQELKTLVSRGRAAAYKQTHGRVLLLSDEAHADGAMKSAEDQDTIDLACKYVAGNGPRSQGNRVLIAPRFGTVALWGLTSPGSLSIFTCYSQNSWESIGISTIR